jgi:NaMN:DMB phosphoribosyltransferase
VLDGIGPLDATAMARAADRLDRLTKPPGSLGQLETVVIELAGITVAPIHRRNRAWWSSLPGTTVSRASGFPPIHPT